MTDSIRDLTLLAFVFSCLIAAYYLNGCEPAYAVDEIDEVESCEICDDVPPTGYPTKIFPYGDFKKMSSPSGGSR